VINDSGVFADTFYWIPFTNVQDLAHERVTTFTQASPPRLIVATEEVLTEYLNYFAAWGARFRGMAAANVQEIRASRRVRIVAQTNGLFYEREQQWAASHCFSSLPDACRQGPALEESIPRN
jgi:hypothetical protein